jgi:hypothetical protein
MIEALEGVGIGVIKMTDLGAPMRATVMKDTHRTIFPANENQWRAADLAAAKIARFGELGFVSEVKPAAVEDALALERKDFL